MLAQRVKQHGPLPVASACLHAQQVALGLQHAHEHGMVHRDIKPHNLILSRQGGKPVVKILDFGLAKATREGNTQTELTGSGQMLGTPDYIAPEQTVDAARADIRADIYSLGCTLYFLLAGYAPFRAASLYELLRAHMQEAAVPLDKVRADIPVELAAVVVKMMAKEPARRYQQPMEVAQALAPFTEGGEQLEAASEAGGCYAALPAASTSGGRRKEKRKTAEQTATAAETQARTSTTIGAGRKKTVLRRSPLQQTATYKRQIWLFAGIGAVVALLLSALIGMLAGGLFRVRTADGTLLVVEVNEPNADVYIDGEKITVTWSNGGKHAEIGIRPGTRKVEVKKDGFTASGEEIDVKEGQHHILTARLNPAPARAMPPAAAISQPAPPPSDKAAPPAQTSIGPAPPAQTSERPRQDLLPKPVIDGPGIWSKRGDEMVLSSNSPVQQSTLFFGDPEWTDYDFSFQTLKDPSAGNKGGGVFASIRARNSANRLLLLSPA